LSTHPATEGTTFFWARLVLDIHPVEIFCLLWNIFERIAIISSIQNGEFFKEYCDIFFNVPTIKKTTSYKILAIR